MIEILIEIISYGFVGLCISVAIWAMSEFIYFKGKDPKI